MAIDDGVARPELPVSHPTPPPVDGPGPLHGVRVIEIADPFCAFAGKLLADAGADVILVEPPDGSAQRRHEPFADGADRGQPEHELSLAFWAENTSKRSVVCDLETGPGRRFFRQLVASADVLLEATPPGWLTSLGLDHADLTGDPPGNPDLIHVAITPFGRLADGTPGPGSGHATTDLTLLARGGPMWSCGYDDHELPPVRGRGGQGLRMAAHFAVMSTLTALLARPRHGGQFVDVSMVAAANVTTEFASYSWLAARETVQRQTGRHATARPSEPTQVRCADGRYLNTGVPPRTPREFEALASWLTDLGLDEEFPLFALLAMGSEYQKLTLQMILEDPLAGEVFGAGREAMAFIASKLSAHEAFVGFQQRGIASGVVWSPDETLADPHFVERGFPVTVDQPQLGRSVVYPGAPIRFTASPMAISGPAPLLGEHTDAVRREVT
ncbi:MAG: CoA transferase [Actinomycetota bacterium]